MAVLMWISWAERPLSIHELCHALAVRIGPSRSADLDRKNVPLIQTLLGCCLGLVIVEEETSTVRLLHATLRDYLRGYPNLFHDAHATMAEVCLTYLNFESVKKIPLDSILIPSELPFVEYASHHWGTHARNAITEPVMLLALELLNQYPNHIGSEVQYIRENTNRLLSPIPSRFTALHCVVAFGISELLVEIDITGVGERGRTGRTPLSYAAANGHEQVLKALLDQTDTWRSIKYSDGLVPIFGILGVIWTPWYQAIRTLYESPSTEISCPDKLGQTLLLRAACGTSEGVVRLLVDRKDLDPNFTSGMGQTALHLAAITGNKGIVKILLGRHGLEAQLRDREDLTPLCCAAASGHEEIVKLLLDRKDVDPNVADRNGQTPLIRASQYGHDRAVKVLLERDAVDPNVANCIGQTALHRATQNCYPGVAELLLRRRDLDPNIEDTSGQTPLF